MLQFVILEHDATYTTMSEYLSIPRVNDELQMNTFLYVQNNYAMIVHCCTEFLIAFVNVDNLVVM